MAPQYVIGVDLGGTWVRACLADAQGKIVVQSDVLPALQRGAMLSSGGWQGPFAE